uniref:BPI2 domain-containing protein n=1 Tax=Mesocestoides corti TaxID=53468 RepID=A0A5K3FFP4_MESCO
MILLSVDLLITEPAKLPHLNLMLGDTLASVAVPCKHVSSSHVCHVRSDLPSAQLHPCLHILEPLSSDLTNLTFPNVDKLGTVQIIKIGNVSRSCPLTTIETVDKGVSTFLFSACVNVTDVVIKLTDKSLTAKVGQGKFDVSFQITKSVKPTPKVTISIPVWKGTRVDGSFLAATFVSFIFTSKSTVKLILQGAINSALQKIKWDAI